MHKALVCIACVFIIVFPALPAQNLALSQEETPTLQFWTTETAPERVERTQAIIDQFTAETGIEVNLVLTEQDEIDELIDTNFAAETLPDVIFHPLDFTQAWYAKGILDADAATVAIQRMGEETFSALSLVSVAPGRYAAIPSDGWGQLLIYRKDLFDEADLPAPTTFEQIEQAAATLHDPDNDLYGITAATDPSEVFMQQTFEHFALANGAQLTDGTGTVTLDTPEMIDAIAFYADLMANYGPPAPECGIICTRSIYLAGEAAMIVWSPFILDELAGLRDGVPTTCPQCEENPAFLAENSAVVPAFQGPHGIEPAQYGTISSLGITATAQTDLAAEFVEFWLNDGYLGWLALSPEGKFPMRRGTPDDPDRFVRGWGQLETGVDRFSPLNAFYSDEVLAVLVEGATNFDRWGFSDGQGELVGSVYQELPIPTVLVDVIDGTISAEEAAAEAQVWVEDLQSQIER
jgi:multiple sugar transport system substrate-binding protein